jgi:transposase-like protein
VASPLTRYFRDTWLASREAQSISHIVWLYVRFALSYRGVEKLLAEREVILPYETVCQVKRPGESLSD